MVGGEGMDEDDPAVRIENMYYNRCACMRGCEDAHALLRIGGCVDLETQCFTLRRVGHNSCGVISTLPLPSAAPSPCSKGLLGADNAGAEAGFVDVVKLADEQGACGWEVTRALWQMGRRQGTHRILC